MDYIKFNGGHNGGGGAFNCSQRFFIRVAKYLFTPLSNRIIAKTNLASPRPLSRYPQCSSKILFACDFDSLCVRFCAPPRGAGRGARRTKEGGGRMVDCCLDPWKPPRLAALSFLCFPTIVSIPCIGKTSTPFQASLLLPPFFFWPIRILPSFLLSFPSSAFVETGRNMDGGRGGGGQ